MTYCNAEQCRDLKLVAATVLCGVVMECDCDGYVTISGTCITNVFYIHIYSYGTMMVIVHTHTLYMHLHTSCVNCVIRV